MFKRKLIGVYINFLELLILTTFNVHNQKCLDFKIWPVILSETSRWSQIPYLSRPRRGGGWGRWSWRAFWRATEVPFNWQSAGSEDVSGCVTKQYQLVWESITHWNLIYLSLSQNTDTIMKTFSFSFSKNHHTIAS